MKYLLVFVPFLFTSSFLYAQKGTEDSIFFNCCGKEFEVKYPKKQFKIIKNEHYGEGFFIGIIFNDTTFLQTHCGFQTTHPFLKGNDYIVDSTDQKSDYIKRIGRSGDGRSFWREDYYPKLHITLAYFQVKQKRKHEFDLCLEAFEKKYRN